MDFGFIHRMLTETESEILLVAMSFVKMEGEYILETSGEIFKKEDKILSWDDVYTKNSYISEELYNEWVLKNQAPIVLNSLSEKIDSRFLSKDTFDSYFKSPEKAWSVFYTITRPGISSDGQSAILQVTARCPSSPPNYTSLLFLEKSIHFWNVKSTHGIYTQ